MRVFGIPVMTMFVALLAGMWLTASGPAVVSAQEQVTTTRDRTIGVSGTGQVEVVPDVVVVQIGVETQADVASDALEQNNEQMAALLESLTTSGITSDSIRTQQVQVIPIYPMSGMEPAPPPATPGEAASEEGANQISGYRAVNVVTVRMQGIEGLGELLDSAVAAGGNRIDGIWFEVSDPETALEEARANAWAAAERKAQSLASLAGVELGEVVAIEETSYLPLPMASMRSASDMGVPIQPGTQTLQADIHVTWRIADSAE